MIFKLKQVSILKIFFLEWINNRIYMNCERISKINHLNVVFGKYQGESHLCYGRMNLNNMK
jgi:hypothetical protein